MRRVTTGFLLALLLTLVAFGVVQNAGLPPRPALAVLAGLAALQMAVHFRCFLGLGGGAADRLKLIALACTAIVMVFLVGGSLWVLSDLNARMTY